MEIEKLKIVLHLWSSQSTIQSSVVSESDNPLILAHNKADGPCNPPQQLETLA